MKEGIIVKVSGPLVVAKGMEEANMFDVVKVSDKNLIGEIIEMNGDTASIQVYEETSGIGPGEKIVPTGMPLSVELGPGMLTAIYDGIQRPLEDIYEKVGKNIERGIEVSSINKERKWTFKPKKNVGDSVTSGDIIGGVQETKVIECKIMVPFGIEGIIKEIKSGDYTVTETICVVEDKKGKLHNIQMLQKWPVRKPRPVNKKLNPDDMLVTGQRVIDTFFPITKGGTCAIPGAFGSGKTVIQHQLAKWADADIIVYVGCGERGNEMTDVLTEFPHLTDPRTKDSLMNRTVLIANTSDMPVAAREASIYTGITIAEFYRDMGYNVALMADSTSRWAEALREMSGRLEEMPGEEGYPAYLGSRIAEFYERAGKVEVLGNDKRTGTLTVIGAVSPAGGDISEPVSQGSLRIVKVFWGLDASLAAKRHFPSINWLTSYSLYKEQSDKWVIENVSKEFVENRNEAMKILQEEAKLQEIVQLVGIDAVSSKDRVILEVARLLREDYLAQDAFDDVDCYASSHKQERILKMIFKFYDKIEKAVEAGISIDEYIKLPYVSKIGKAKFIEENKVDEEFDKIEFAIENETKLLIEKGGLA
ncbi:MAG: V-type ATP synthase subunit A [Clostridia bacterium]|nr:V-type ATP synthase subunit A [Clostridia bacterium]